MTHGAVGAVGPAGGSQDRDYNPRYKGTKVANRLTNRQHKKINIFFIVPKWLHGGYIATPKRGKKKGDSLTMRNALISGADERIRTADLLITNQLLYRLSYIGFDDGWRNVMRGLSGRLFPRTP